MVKVECQVVIIATHTHTWYLNANPNIKQIVEHIHHIHHIHTRERPYAQKRSHAHSGWIYARSLPAGMTPKQEMQKCSECGGKGHKAY